MIIKINKRFVRENITLQYEVFEKRKKKNKYKHIYPYETLKY